MAKESFETKDIGIAKDTYVCFRLLLDNPMSVNNKQNILNSPQDVLHKLLEAFETCDILVCTGS